MDQVLKMALRAVVPTRLRTLDAYHPLTSRAWDADTPVRRAISQRTLRAAAGHNSDRFKVLSRLRRTFNLTDRVPCTELLPPAPPAPDPTNGLSKEEAAAALRKKPPDADAVVYLATDQKNLVTTLASATLYIGTAQSSPLAKGGWPDLKFTTG
ncbi:hypothetical protein E4U56_005187, partial [Claviceps arundinis]